jgi:hypothetical protein
MGHCLFDWNSGSKHHCIGHRAYAPPISKVALVAATARMDWDNHWYDYIAVYWLHSARYPDKRPYSHYNERSLSGMLLHHLWPACDVSISSIKIKVEN